ncbi:SsrA-binding protein SmpB [Candidatus Uabimicrobium sp. HlEnr_7]|uniref:SsrA-binding protein SmpB n=1 Tax=Candidatus Uabimicrobium helgolandensis TaxID=3095367 RepID=UPI003556F7E0
MKKAHGNIKIILKNKKAFHNYNILDRFEVGIALVGTEIKSIRNSKVNVGDAFCKIDKNDEISLFNMNISTYEKGGYSNHDPLRPRKLLMHKREIRRLKAKLQQRGFTLVPISVYLKNGRAKIELGLGKGKDAADKRETLKKRDAQREIKKFDY